jgi:hypothetical protein
MCFPVAEINTKRLLTFAETSTLMQYEFIENFIYLFNDVVSSPSCIASSERMISEHWIGRDVEGSGRGLI